jgi:ribosomal protein S18 acetylase RimI-like enzyme
MDPEAPKTNRVPILFREARLEEASLLRDFQLEMAMESERLRLDPEICGRGVHAVFDDPNKGAYWIAESAETGEVLGCTLLETEWSDWRARTVLWIHSLYVRPAYRGRGIYRAMYEAIQARARMDAGIGGIRLYVDRSNEAAIRVYEKLGMTREHYHLYEWLK